MIEYVKRLAGPFTAEGATSLPFGFKIFDPTDVFVATSTDPNTSSTALVYGKDYSVKMNEDQDTVPGGTVVLSSPISTGRECQDCCVWGGYSRGSPTRLSFPFCDVVCQT